MPKSAPSELKRATRQPKTGPRDLRQTQEGPKTAQDRPKREKRPKTDTQKRPRKTKRGDMRGQRGHTRERSRKESQERPKPKRDRRPRQKVNTTVSRRESQGISQRPKRRKIEAQSWQHSCLQSFFYLRSRLFPLQVQVAENEEKRSGG